MRMYIGRPSRGSISVVGATGPGALEERRDWRRVTMIAAPWVVAAALGVLGVLGARSAPPGPAAASTATTSLAAAGSTPAPGEVPSAAPPAPDTSLDAAPALAPEVELAVLAAARVALGTAGTTSTAAGAVADRWPVDARVAAVEAVTADHLVATVHGLVIEHRDDTWHGPTPQAVAVLVRTGPAPGVVGQAWPLPPPPLASATPELRAVDEVDPSVVAPLEDAGWAVVEVTAVEVSPDALLRVALHGTPPGRQRPGDHEVWLLDAPGGPRLLPLPPRPDTEELP